VWVVGGPAEKPLAAEIVAAGGPGVRDLTGTDLRNGILAMAAAGGLRGALEAMLADKDFYRSAEALGPAYEHPQRLADETIETYLRPLVSSEQRTRDLQRFLGAFDCSHTLAIESQLRALQTPTLIVWGTDDIYFGVQWSHWLAEAIPGVRRRVELEGARIFFPEERAAEFNRELRAHWLAVGG
jgi:pimeloyl-ACP methyl ester carboxylesterase